MAKAILIAVSDGFGGYGDFLFALKLAQQLKKKYADAGEDVPPIHIVTQATGKRRIIELRGDVEFGVSVLTPDELEMKIVAKEIEIGHLIEAPVFYTELMDDINSALYSIPNPVPFTMIPEYGFNIERQEKKIEYQVRYRHYRLKKLKDAKLLYPGFNDDNAERGILLSYDLVTPPAPEALVAKLDAKLRAPLVGMSDIAHYQANTELSMQYSHDIYETAGPAPAVHFLNTHCEFAKNSIKNQDVIMVGRSIVHKRAALEVILDKLISYGFERIAFYNADTNTEKVLYDSSRPGKAYRVIYTAGMSHESMIACTALSGPLTGATGDQSLSEALSANRMMVYECLPHKQNLIESYDAAMIKGSDNDPQIIETLKLLRTASTEEEYQRLGMLLRDTGIQSTFTALNKALMKKYDFVSHVVREALGWDPALSEVATRLQQVSLNPASVFRALLRKTPGDEDSIESPAPRFLGKPDH